MWLKLRNVLGMPHAPRMGQAATAAQGSGLRPSARPISQALCDAHMNPILPLRAQGEGAPEAAREISRREGFGSTEERQSFSRRDAAAMPAGGMP